jgi:hypothetical protein
MPSLNPFSKASLIRLNTLPLIVELISLLPIAINYGHRYDPILTASTLLRQESLSSQSLLSGELLSASEPVRHRLASRADRPGRFGPPAILQIAPGL